jgi:O-antigen ligase
MIALTLNLFGVRTFEKHFEGIERVIWLSRGIGICIVYMIITSEWRMRPMVLVMVSILLLQFGIMLYIGSRGPLLSVIVSMGIFFFIKYRKDITKTVLLGIVGVTIIVAFMNIKALSDYVHFFSTHRGTIKLSFFGQDRLVAYRPSLEIFADHPITGVGLGKWWSVYRPRMSPLSEIHDRSYLKKIRGEIDYDYPHNIFLEILSELGLVGMGLFVLLFIPFKRLFRLSNEYNLLCLLGFLYASSSSDISQNSAPMIFNILSILRAKNLLPASSD